MKSTATHSPSKSEAKGHTEGSITPRHGQFLQQSCRLANPLPGRAPPDRPPRREFLSPRPLKTVIFCKQLRLLKQCDIDASCLISLLNCNTCQAPGKGNGQSEFLFSCSAIIEVLGRILPYNVGEHSPPCVAEVSEFGFPFFGECDGGALGVAQCAPGLLGSEIK